MIFLCKEQDELLVASFVYSYNNEFTGDKSRLPVMKISENDPRKSLIFMNKEMNLLINLSPSGDAEDFYISNVEVVSLENKFNMLDLASSLYFSNANAFVFKCSDTNRYKRLVEWWGGFHLMTETNNGYDLISRKDFINKINVLKWDDKIKNNLLLNRGNLWQKMIKPYIDVINQQNL